MFQTKRRAQSGFRLLKAKTRKKRKQRVSAAASNHDFAVEEPNLGVARALVVILILHLAAIAAIVVHHNTTKDDVAAKDGPLLKKDPKAALVNDTTQPQIDWASDQWKWVESGDTYERVAREFQVDVAELRRLNENHALVPGMALKIPSKQAVAAVAVEPVESPQVAEPILTEELPPIVEVPARLGIPAEYEVVSAAQDVESSLQSLPIEERIVEQTQSDRSIGQTVVQERPQSPPAAKTYTVKSGDSLWAIAKRHGIPLSTLERANPKVNPRSMKIGAQLVIPSN